MTGLSNSTVTADWLKEVCSDWDWDSEIDKSIQFWIQLMTNQFNGNNEVTVSNSFKPHVHTNDTSLTFSILTSELNFHATTLHFHNDITIVIRRVPVSGQPKCQLPTDKSITTMTTTLYTIHTRLLIMMTNDSIVATILFEAYMTIWWYDIMTNDYIGMIICGEQWLIQWC